MLLLADRIHSLWSTIGTRCIEANVRACTNRLSSLLTLIQILASGLASSKENSSSSTDIKEVWHRINFGNGSAPLVSA